MIDGDEVRASAAAAVDIYCLRPIEHDSDFRNTHPCYGIHIEGEITLGDYAKSRSILASAEPWAYDVTLVRLVEVTEAIQIGRLIRERLL
jgi:hypothetical protein